VVREIEDLLSELSPFVSLGNSGSDCCIHNDLHEWNIMCDAQGGLLTAWRLQVGLVNPAVAKTPSRRNRSPVTAARIQTDPLQKKYKQ
jgi:hypothetical protein